MLITIESRSIQIKIIILFLNLKVTTSNADAKLRYWVCAVAKLRT